MACSKYTIINTGSTITNFNYRRCDDSMWEYQVELAPSETKTIWLINDTYSTAYNSGIIVSDSSSYPPPPPTLDVFDSTLNFPLTYTSIRLRCNGTPFFTEYTSETVNTVQELADLFNSNAQASQWGTYYDAGNDTLGLAIPLSLAQETCTEGTGISMQIFED